MAPLARDQHGNPFELPEEAVYWRVRRHTGGRPSTVLGPDGEPLFIPITGDKHDLRGNGCNGSIRLESVDDEHRSVNAPVAFVELGTAESVETRNAAPIDNNADLVRSSFESMTRTMEAMQRAQVERERALAQKERALTDAQVEMQRSHVQLVVALMERSGGGKPQDPLTILKQQMEFQTALEQRARGSHRNAGLLPAAVGAETEKPGFMKYVMSALPFAPMVADMIAKEVAKTDPVKAAGLRRNVGAFANAAATAAQVFGGQPPAPPPSCEAPVDPTESVDSAELDDVTRPADEPNEIAEIETRPTPSRAVREVQAQLNDDEASAFDEYLDELEASAFAELCYEAESIVGLAARVAWVRGLIRGVESSVPTNAASDDSTRGAAPTVAGIMEFPPSLLPVLSQLTDEERMMGAQIISALDRATLEGLSAELGAMPAEQALATIRRAIAESRRRSASVAQRAVRAALRTDDDSASAGVTA